LHAFGALQEFFPMTAALLPNKFAPLKEQDIVALLFMTLQESSWIVPFPLKPFELHVPGDPLLQLLFPMTPYESRDLPAPFWKQTPILALLQL